MKPTLTWRDWNRSAAGHRRDAHKLAKRSIDNLVLGREKLARQFWNDARDCAIKALTCQCFANGMRKGKK